MYTLFYSTELQNCQVCPKSYYSFFQRSFSIHMRMGGVRKRVIDYTFNYLPQQKFRDVQSADFVFILVTGQEERR